MPENHTTEKGLQGLRRFFGREISQKGVRPLRKGVQLAIYIGGNGPYTLSREKTEMKVLATPPSNPDMTFEIPLQAIQQLEETETKDIGELGVIILKLMAHSDPSLKIRAKVHIGLFGLLRNGYLGILPLGGTTVMKFLASKGFSNIGRIKDALLRLRS